MNQAIALRRLRPVIDRTFPFAAAQDLYRHFAGCGHFGKVVITHWLTGYRIPRAPGHMARSSSPTVISGGEATEGWVLSRR